MAKARDLTGKSGGMPASGMPSGGLNLNLKPTDAASKQDAEKKAKKLDAALKPQGPAMKGGKAQGGAGQSSARPKV